MKARLGELDYYYIPELMDIGVLNIFTTKIAKPKQEVVLTLKHLTGMERLYTLKQVHSKNVIELLFPLKDEEEIQEMEADGLITDLRGIGIGILTADCFPLLLAGRGGSLIAMLHCGYKGILRGIVEEGISSFKKKGIGSDELLAGIGPGIRGCCYEVREDVLEAYQAKFPDGNGLIWELRDGKIFLFLDRAIRKILEENKIGPNNIFELRHCTFCNSEFFSYRREKLRTSRQINLAMIKRKE